MATYSLIQRHNFFDLTLPKAVVEVCNKLKLGECGKFSFLEPSSTAENTVLVNRYMRVRTRLVVKKLSDGSWNLTNSGSESVLNNMDGTPTSKNVFILTKSQEDELKREPPEATTTESWDEAAEEEASEAESPTRNVTSPSAKKVDGEEDESGLLDHNYTGGEGDGAIDKEEADTAGSRFLTVGIENENKIIIVKPEKSGSGINEDQFRNLKNIFRKTLNSMKPIMSKRYRDKNSPACPICSALSKDSFNLMKHMKRSHSEHERFGEEIAKLMPLMQVTCNECGHKFRNRKILSEHIQNVHQHFMGIQCPHCVKKYKTKNHLRMHVKYAHMRKEKSFPCDQCTSRFDTKKILSTHILYHHANLERTNTCDLCDYKYAFQKQYYEHRSRVHGPKKEICPHCAYKCATKWYMNKHMVGCNKNRMKHLMPIKRTSLQQPMFVTNKQLLMDGQSQTVSDGHIVTGGKIGTDGQIVTDGHVAADGQMVTDEQMMTDGQVVTDMPVITGEVQDVTEYAPVEVTEALVQIENREMAGSDASEPVVELPAMWDLQTGNGQVVLDSVIQGTEQVVCEDQMVIVKQEDQMQQFAILGPDGTQHIIQLMYPDTSAS